MGNLTKLTAMLNSTQQFVLSENVRHFRARLAEATDANARRVLNDLVTVAERELALLEASVSGVRPVWQKIPPAQLECARTEAIAWFQAHHGASPLLAALIDPAPGLAMVEVNNTYLRATGMTREDIVGRPLFELFPDNPEDPQADGVKNLYASLRSVAQTGQPHAMSLQRYDTHDAAGVWTPRYWRPANSARFDAEGRVVLLLHVVEEVTAEGAPLVAETAG